MATIIIGFSYRVSYFDLLTGANTCFFIELELLQSSCPCPSAGIYRISVAVPPMAPMLPSGFTFNQFLVVDDKPLLYHTGMKVRGRVKKHS